MVLVDYQIQSLCEAGMVKPYHKQMINPCSLDIRVGHSIMVETEKGWEKIDISDRTLENPVMLKPQEFILVASLEIFNIPNNICAEFALKSSTARDGYDHASSSWIDAGWKNSVLTMEIRNNRRFKSLPIYPYLRIGQIVFFPCNPPVHNYYQTGKYNHDLSVQSNKS